MKEFLRGAALLGRGFGFWRRRPGVMALGFLPAALVAIVLLAGLIVWGVNLPRLTDAITPFADGWPGLWATVIRVTIGTALFGAALVLVAVTFTALTLIVGEPFYQRIWQSIEREQGGGVPDVAYGFWRSVGDGLSLLVRGILVAIAAALIGVIPVVGGIVGTVAGVLMTGWLIADELVARAMTARGLDRTARRALLKGHRARALGFGVAAQLCFLIPLGAVATMPAAVAGSTLLARSMLGEGQLEQPARDGSSWGMLEG